MKKVLFDTNIILDIALKREGFYDDSSICMQLLGESKILGYISANSITDIYYIINKTSGHKKTIHFLISICNILDIVDLEKEDIFIALNSNMEDFEDAIQSQLSSKKKLDFILTRNIKDFKNSKTPPILPKDLLRKF